MKIMMLTLGLWFDQIRHYIFDMFSHKVLYKSIKIKRNGIKYILFNIILSNLMYGLWSSFQIMVVLKLTFSKKRLSVSFETITTANLLFFKEYQIKKTTLSRTCDLFVVLDHIMIAKWNCWILLKLIVTLSIIIIQKLYINHL